MMNEILNSTSAIFVGIGLILLPVAAIIDMAIEQFTDWNNDNPDE